MSQALSLTASRNSQDVTFRFSEIATLLQGRLTNSEINDLLIELLSQTTVDVQPGDLISAEWAMNLARRLERLELKPSQAPAYIEKVATCLAETASFYDKLLIKAAFIPTDTTGVSAKAIMQATGTLQRIINVTLSGAAIVTLADSQQLLGAFQSLYVAQSDLASLLSSQLLGTSEAGSRNNFSALLKAQLDSDQGAVLSLKSALNQGKLDAAVLAQNRINGVVMNYTGDVTNGGIHILYIGSNGAGRVLKQDDTNPIQYTFQVFNKTNKTLDIHVSSAFRRPHADWSESVDIMGATDYRALSPYDSTNATDPKAFRMIDVLVTTPPMAELNETGTLELVVKVPAPISITNSGSVELSIGTDRVPEGASWVRFTGLPYLTAESENPTNIQQQTSYTIGFQFHGADSTVHRKFKLKIDVTSTGTDQLFEFDTSEISGGGAKPVLDPSGRTRRINYESQELDIISDEARAFNIDVWPKSGSSGMTLNYKVNIISVDGALQPSAFQTASITVN